MTDDPARVAALAERIREALMEGDCIFGTGGICLCKSPYREGLIAFGLIEPGGQVLNDAGVALRAHLQQQATR